MFPDKIFLQDAGLRNGSRLFKLEKPYRFFSSKGLITVPAGFITDGASIPRVFWNILSPYGEYFPAALIHDVLYSDFNLKYTRKESDLIFLEGMKAVGVNWITRNAIFYSVNLFGWAFYRGKK